MAEERTPNGRVVTFDFDCTLVVAEYDRRWRAMVPKRQPNAEMIDRMWEYHEAGYTVGIVTARDESGEGLMEGYGCISVPDFVAEHNLPVDFIRYTNNQLKAPLLLELGSELHHDDDYAEIECCKRHGVNVYRVHQPAEIPWGPQDERSDG
jgi:hypothetical protein